MKMKKLLACAMAGMVTLGIAFTETSAATRDEIAAIKVSKSGKFNYWSADSEVKNKLVDYMKDITNKNSKNFIPVEDRIAVFDMDGTVLCETAPYYFEWMLYLDRALYDENYKPTQEEKDYAKLIEEGIRVTKKFPPQVDVGEAAAQDKVFVGMTEEQYKDYLQKFMDKPVEGLTNLKWGESFYLPMVEVIRYLQSNDFTVYIVSGSDREAVRILACEPLKLKSDNIIGSDINILAAGQGDKDGLNYVYKKDDYLVRGELTQKTLKMNKVLMISREIGKQPVLAFGNSSGDSSMLNYAINGNKYKALSFMLLCDDLERELGNEKKAENCKKLADENGWISVSMKNDFKTIYGDNVKREQ